MRTHLIAFTWMCFVTKVKLINNWKFLVLSDMDWLVKDPGLGEPRVSNAALLKMGFLGVF